LGLSQPKPNPNPNPNRPGPHGDDARGDHGAQRATAGHPRTKGGAGACEAVQTHLLPTRTYLPRAGIGRPLEYFTREYDHTNAAHHLALGFKSPADAERFKELVWPQVLARAK